MFTPEATFELTGDRFEEGDDVLDEAPEDEQADDDEEEEEEAEEEAPDDTGEGLAKAGAKCRS
jgi:hypothetical protein